MDFIKKYWVLLLILALVAYFVYKYWQKNKEVIVQEQISQAKPILNNITSNTGTVEVVQPKPSSSINQDSTSWEIGNKLYAGPTGVNTYSSPSATSSNIVKFYRTNSYIGTYLGKENGFIKVIVTEKVDSLVSLVTGIPEISNKVVYSIANQLYSK